jgi:site-specific recombinase XerD
VDIDHNKLLEQFEALLTDSGLASATVVNYLADLRAFLQWSELARGAGCSLFSLDASDIQAYCSYLQEAKDHQPATVNRRLQALRKFYDFSVAQGWSEANPASDVPLLSEKASKRTRSLTAADVSRLLAAVQDGHPRRVKRDSAIMHVLIGAGLKLSELSDLRLADVHLEAEPGFLVVGGQGGEANRTVPLEEQVRRALRSYVSTRQAAPGVDRMFVNRDGNNLSTRSIQRLVRRYARAAGLDNLTTQALRYVYAKQVYENKGDLKAVAELLGHRHLATTSRYLRPCLPSNKSSEEREPGET